MSYIFGEGTGLGYGDIQKRRIAQQLPQKKRDGFGEGLNAVLKALEGGAEADKPKPGANPYAAPEGGSAPLSSALGGDMGWKSGSGEPKADAPGGLDPRLAGAWGQFTEAARAAGHELNMNSGFRDPGHQARIIADNWHKFDLNPADRDRWVADVEAMGPVEAGRKWEGIFTNARRTVDGSGTPFRNWIALPGRSQHQRGMAIDIGYSSPQAREWAHQNAKNFGMVFPLSNEPWHIELIGGREVAVGDISGQPITPAG